MTSTAGERFARALADKDAAALKALLRADVDFKALTPGMFWEATDAESVVDEMLLGQWFEAEDRITGLAEVENGSVGPRRRVRYQLNVSCPDGDYLVEQQAYYETDGAQISWLRILCAGYLRVDDG